MLDLLAAICLCAGVLFFGGVVVGLVRFPDFYTRIHAAAKGDTFSELLVLLGLAIYHLHDFSYQDVLISLKIMLILVFVFVTSPTGAHAIMDAGYTIGPKPWVKPEDHEKEDMQ